mgnify:CR=1 FL=1
MTNMHTHPDRSALPVHADEHVATAPRAPAAGDAIAVREPIARGHKVALRVVAAGKTMLKYGCPIGRATRGVAIGDHDHSHDMHTALGQNPCSCHPQAAPAALAAGLERGLLGYAGAAE